MVTLTRLSGSLFALNSDLIERVDATPDTVITLVDGKKYIVRESLRDVVEAIRSYRGAIIAESARVTRAADDDDDYDFEPPTETRHLAAVPVPPSHPFGSRDSRSAVNGPTGEDA